MRFVCLFMCLFFSSCSNIITDIDGRTIWKHNINNVEFEDLEPILQEYFNIKIRESSNYDRFYVVFGDRKGLPIVIIWPKNFDDRSFSQIVRAVSNKGQDIKSEVLQIRWQSSKVTRSVNQVGYIFQYSTEIDKINIDVRYAKNGRTVYLKGELKKSDNFRLAGLKRGKESIVDPFYKSELAR